MVTAHIVFPYPLYNDNKYRKGKISAETLLNTSWELPVHHFFLSYLLIDLSV